MKLKATDQIHISSVKSDSLRPGEAFEVSDDLGKELLARHPTKVAAAEQPDEKQPQEKAEPAPANKAEKAAPKNK